MTIRNLADSSFSPYLESFDLALKICSPSSVLSEGRERFRIATKHTKPAGQRQSVCRPLAPMAIGDFQSEGDGAP